MKYTILSVKATEEHVFTEVRFDFADGKSVTETFPHFRPTSVSDVILGIENRFVSEELKKDAATVCADVASQIKLNETVEK